VYYNALQSERYTLNSPVSDEPITINGMGMKDWSPKNYDGRSHGNVPLSYALAHSYNLATVRLGWEIGIPSFINTMHSLGIEDEIKPYPAILLGAVNLSPMQVLGMYQVYAANGFRYAPRSIRSVVDSKGNPLQRYGLNVRQSLDSGAVYLLNNALQQVMRSGTGASAYRTLPASLNLAGKSGTTNDARDSWFAGYSGNYVAVVWLGHDDNRPIGLTGSSGALPVWVNIMKQLTLTPVEPIQPSNVQWQWIDQSSGNLSAQGCAGATYIPLLVGTVPNQATDCAMQAIYSSQQAPYGDSQVDEFGEPVYQQYARRLPEPRSSTDIPNNSNASITLELPADPDTGKPPVVKRFWSGEN
ncbi:MAG: penicillin-binding protein 1B, partial [Moraxellaceae bacterium]